jgi:NADH dehydrogenase (ubiquinone) 1 alpha subcomplex subunit 9
MFNMASASRMAAIANQRYASSAILPHGAGGRSSVSGVVATVFGATGFLGRYVVNNLAKIGGQVVVPYRGDDSAVRFLRPMGDLGQIHFLEYGILDAPSVSKSMAYSNVVVNCTGQDYHSRHFTLTDIHVEGARNVARAARENGVERLIHVSALGASEASPSEFMRTKALGEKAVLEEFPNATIVRPAVCFGMEDRFLSRIALLHKLPFGIFPLICNGEALKQPVYGPDVSEGIVATLKQKDAVGSLYEFYGPKAYSVEEIISFVGQLVKQKHRPIPVPEMATPLLAFGARVASIPRIKRIINPEEIHRLALSDLPTRDVKTLADVGVEAKSMDEYGLRAVRRFRPSATHDDYQDGLLLK